MRKNRRLLGIVAAFFVLYVAVPAGAWHRTRAEIFAILPNGATGPEGLTVGPDGNVYVATFGFNSSGSVGGHGQLYVFDPNGHLLRNVTVQGSTPFLLGLAFHPTTHELLVLDSAAGGGGSSQVFRVDPHSGNSSVFMTVTGGAGLNALTFDKNGNVYVSDSFQGIIWKCDAVCGHAGTAWVNDASLRTSGVPPFGANGLEFNNAGDALFVANTGNDTLVKISFNSSTGAPGTPSVFVNSINGADGIAIDKDDNIWVAANQADEIVVVDKTGKVIAKLGDFEGVSQHGVPQGLLFPASPAFSADGKWLYVTNLGLDLRIFGLPTVDSQWCAQVRHYTVSKIRARIPGIGEDDDHHEDRD
jgi:sugar lactone lactonase YvrE